jgi:hypothetical protein
VVTIDGEGGKDFEGINDIFDDVIVMRYLKEGELVATMSAKERNQILQQTKHFVWEETHLLRVRPDGDKKVVLSCT